MGHVNANAGAGEFNKKNSLSKKIIAKMALIVAGIFFTTVLT